MSRLSIRWRLTLWNTAALAVLLLTVGSLVYALLRHAMYEQLDRVLLAQFGELVHDERIESDPESRLRHWIDEFHEHVGMYSVIYDADGSVFARTEQLAEQSVPIGPNGHVNPPEFGSRELPLVGWQRTMTRSFETDGRQLVVMLMLPLEETRRELRQAAAVLLGVLPFALLLASGMGYTLARKALSPVDQLRRATDEITAERLSRRIDVPNPNDEFGRLGQTINAMIARLERSFAEIRRFTADASHELRTPISVIRTEAEVAMQEPPGPEEYRSIAANILEECERLTRLTDQLLTLSREDTGVTPLESERLDFAELVAHVADMMRPLTDAKQQTLKLNSAESLPVVGDAARLRQVVYNLLDNAIKYTPEAGRIGVEVREQGDLVALVVRDNGIGIAPEHLPHVRERFYRVDQARSRDEGGTGLGLSIVDSIVAAHGGQVEIISRAGEGTTCTVLLPRACSET
jgi:heavy metal sensor kinase